MGAMSLFRDDGIVLRTQKLGEADRIITLLTRGHGRVRAVARGVRRTKSKFGARLEPFSHVDVQFFSKGSELIGRGLPLCTQSETIAPYGGGIVTDYARYTAGTAMLETAERFTDHEGEPAVQQYLLLVGALRTLARGEHAPHLVLDAFLLRSLAVNGYAPSFTDCAKCGMPGPNRFFSVASGGSICPDCRVPGSVVPSPQALELLGALLTGDWETGWSPPPCTGIWSAGCARSGTSRSDARSRTGHPEETRGMAVRGFLGRQRQEYRTPEPHPSGARPPKIPGELVPKHVAIVMDGNGRWAKERGLPRTEGHKVGAERVLDVLQGGLEMGVGAISLYAFSTENWKRSPDEVRFLMNFNRDVIRRRRDEMSSWGVRIRWAGRRPRLWGSVIKELQVAEEMTRENDRCTLTMCVNYGGRAEVADAAAAIAREAAAGRINPDRVTEKTVQKYLDEPDLPDVDLFLRSSGEQRTSNFMIWQAAYAELVFLPEPWPDVDRRHLWRAVEEYARRDRRYGGAVDAASTT